MPPPRRLGISCVLLLVAATLLEIHVSVHGPNAAVPPIGSASSHPLSPGITYLLTGLAALAGAGSTACGLLALKRGWGFGAYKIFALGLVAAGSLALVHPVGTADIGSYAAYGHMQTQHIDSYDHTPSQFSDAFSSAAENPWRDTPNVYGPLGTWIFKHSAELGSKSPADTIRWLQRLAWIAFALTGFLLLRATRNKRRAALIWTANPLLALHLVSGAHVDVFVALLVVVAVRCTKSPVGRGVAAGAAIAVKATAAWASLGLVLGRPRRGRLRRLLAAGLVAGLAYSFASSHVFGQAHKASRFVSAGTPWRWVASFLEVFLPHGLARTLVAIAAVTATLFFAAMLTISFGDWPEKGTPERAARSALIPALAWMLLAPYQLPWYDATVWALLAVSVAMGIDWVVLLHTAVLTIAYLPGRVVDLGTVPHGMQIALRSGLAPVVLTGCVLAAPWALQRRPNRRGATL